MGSKPHKTTFFSLFEFFLLEQCTDKRAICFFFQNQKSPRASCSQGHGHHGGLYFTQIGALSQKLRPVEFLTPHA